MNTDNTIPNELIVLAHGFGAIRAVVWPLAHRLRKSGFRVVFWNYLPLFASIELHANRFFEYLATQLPVERRFHLVAHSMGSIVTRSALTRGPLSNLGKLVLLAPPNPGSPIAIYASTLLGGIMKPTRELSDAKSSYVNQLAVPQGIDVGIIAAKYDILVPVPNTRLPS